LKLNKKLAIIGAGKIGQTLIGALIETNFSEPREIIATAKHMETLLQVSKKWDIATTLDNSEACEFAEVIFICVKPQIISEVLDCIKKVNLKGKLIITTVASVPTAYIEKILKQPVAVIRTMPNTPCLIKMGMTAIAPGKFVEGHHLELTKMLFDTLGKSIVLDEKHMDAVTGVSGSGPAFMYIILEAIADGGVKVGLPRNVATLLAAQTMLGSAGMILQTHEHPALLKDAVTTPAGCTIDGILKLEEGGLRVTLIKAILKATQTAGKLFRNSHGTKNKR